MYNSHHRLLVNATWLIKLRWVAVVGQLLTIGTVVYGLQIQIPLLWALLVVVLSTAVSNIFLTLWLRNRRRSVDQPLRHRAQNLDKTLG